MPQLFVSYRRSDASGHAGRLIDRLKARFGQSEVFIDVDDIDVGGDFAAAITKAIARADAVILVIGRAWLDCRDAKTGRRRIDDPDDWVRIETTAALQRGIPVVPVYVQNAAHLESGQLPDALAPLSSRQWVALDDAQWDAGIAHLIGRLERLPGLAGPTPARSRWKPLLWTTALAIVIAAWLIVDWKRFAGGYPTVPDNATSSTPEAGGDLFHSHPAIGGYWFQQAFNAYLSFQAGGKVTGTYYQYTLTGSWQPLSQDRVMFSARLVEKAEGLTFGWDDSMVAVVSGNTLQLRWPGKPTTDYLIRRDSLPPP